MKRFAIFGAVGAAVITLAACNMGEEAITKTEADVQLDETVAPAAPEAVAGEIQPSNSLNGTYNLRATECGQTASEGALNIQGNQFQFYGGQCTAVKTTIVGDAAETELSCNGEDGQGFNRLVKLRLSPGVMQLEEKGINLRYYRCPDPAA